MGLRKLLGIKKRPRVSTVPTRLVPVGSYEDYRRTQNLGNAAKIANIFVDEANVAYLASYIARRSGSAPRILCHGTRNGAELRYFRNALPDATLLGTEIADSAGQFADTIQWDFHDVKPEWIEAWDVVYSNSWDHAFEPERAFLNWMQCLRPNGVVLLEHSLFHTPAYASELDPFGATLPALVECLNRVGAPRWEVIEILEDLPNRKRNQQIVVVGRSAR
jgi:SAM-dependent methyltransferase